MVVRMARCVLGSVAKTGKRHSPIEMEIDARSFVIAFCGSGTGHMMQALSVCKLMQAAGMVLKAVITDSDAS